ncbi:hypothetical protein M409DRAFT_29248 [Zasmidium cellare ATCC 36951]|uniref:Pentacotripeptide-repeat region of PRORP domain-containing protein n=1 Tax=Zasmidium cellare ATCC 36951 TaxID=1080233 RepID=A0A6A6C3F0_ZASCE|nr:uncharacterized protein M409DRAFT_29248 [Zasmidium cellare ATCC 36951]KAF2160402.1 hypothetical protein M409DRAFT_29248 [Zasmidium cellare ATCC 36951]
MILPSRERRHPNRKDERCLHRTRCGGDIGYEAVASGTRADGSFEDLFIRSLVAASSCREHRKEDYRLGETRRRPIIRPDSQRYHANRRWLSSQPQKKQSAAAAAELPALPEISRHEYKELVNTYPEFDTKVERRRKKVEHQPLAPRLVLTPLEELSRTPGQREILPPEGPVHAANIRNFVRLLKKPLGRISHDKVWELYQFIQSPRPRYLDDDVFARFFRQLSWIQFKDSEITMQRYFELLDECIGEGVPLSREVWNGAINFAARWLRSATSNEVKVAIETWMRMENAGHEADSVTFNILFGVAVRAGRYALADTIYAELRSRDLPINRYFRASMIHYAGVKRDGDGVRQAFRDLVNAGEIVDTAVMNCVILALIRAGEAAAAENVFLRMKALHEQKFGVMSLKDWRRRRQLAKVLDTTGHRLRQEKQQHETSFFGGVYSADERREGVQKVTPIAPDSSTYALMIKHHAYTSGHLDKTRELLEEMRENKHHVHGSVYVHILRGFWTHGGYAFSAWNRRSLEDFWAEIMTASMPSLATPEIIQPAEAPEHDIPESSVDEEDRSDMLGAMMIDHQQTQVNSPHEEPDLDEEPVEIDTNELERPTYFAKGLALAAVHAFYKCTGSKRMLEVWDDIQTRWKDAPEDEREKVQDAVDRMIRQDSIYIH